jgi:hypothetical protein
MEKDKNATKENLDSLNQYMGKVASAYSAAMLVTPMYLLNIALGTFLIGLGVYLGKLYTANLNPSYGSDALGILIVYIVVALTGLSVFYVAQSFKYLENLPRERYNNLLHSLPADSERPAAGDGCTEATQIPQSQALPNNVQQSLHTRSNGRVSFVIDGHEDAIEPDQDDNLDTPPPQTDVLDSLRRPIFSPLSGSPSQSPDDQNLPPNGDALPTDRRHSSDVQSALRDFIRAQEEILQASKRLQASFQSSSEREMVETI